MVCVPFFRTVCVLGVFFLFFSKAKGRLSCLSFFFSPPLDFESAMAHFTMDSSTTSTMHTTRCPFYELPTEIFHKVFATSTNKTLSAVPVRQSLSTSSPSRTCGAESESKQSSRKSVSKQQPPSKHSSGTRTMSAISILTESYSPSFCHKRLPRLRVVLLRLSLALLLLLLRWSLSFQVNHSWTDSCPHFA